MLNEKKKNHHTKNCILPLPRSTQSLLVSFDWCRSLISPWNLHFPNFFPSFIFIIIFKYIIIYICRQIVTTKYIDLVIHTNCSISEPTHHPGQRLDHSPVVLTNHMLLTCVNYFTSVDYTPSNNQDQFVSCLISVGTTAMESSALIHSRQLLNQVCQVVSENIGWSLKSSSHNNRVSF